MSKPLSTVSWPVGLESRQSLGRGLDTWVNTWTGRATAVVCGSAFVALCAHIAVPLPWTPVPMTMQPFAVLLVAMLLGPWLGAASMAAYLAEGAVGLPVFVPGLGGLLPLGLSAGYLLSYPLVALVTGAVFGRGRHFFRGLLATGLGEIVILFCGAAWLAALLHAGPATAFHLGVLPFLAGDSLKVLLAAAVGSGLRHWLTPSPNEPEAYSQT